MPIYSSQSNVKTKTLVVSAPASIIESACTIHLHKFGTLPTLSNCLYCHRNTSIEEIYAFVRRYIQCPSKILFTVLRIEDLDNHSQEVFVRYLNGESQFHNAKPKINAELAIFVGDIDSPIAKELQTAGFLQENIRPYDDTSLGKYLKEQLPASVKVVFSERAGTGKTEWVRQQSKNEIYFPISGMLNRRNILKRLTKLELTNESSLHIDIGHLVGDEDYQEINKILFSLVVLRGLSSFEFVFSLPDICKIYIEIHESSSKISILKLLKLNSIRVHELSHYNPEVSAAPRIVFSILVLYDKGELSKTDFSTFKTENVKVSIQDAQRLLEKYFLSKVKAPNFYKIKIFLALAADLFSRFAKSVFFYNSNLSFAKLDQKIKNTVCEAIIEYSREYTVRSIDYAMNCQRKALNESSEHDSKLGEVGDAIGFESIKDFSLLFDDTGCCIPIYKDDTKIPKIFMDLLQSQRLDIYQPSKSRRAGQRLNYKTPFELEHYVNMNSNILIDKLCEFNGINPKERAFLYEACRSYVMTADNFFKICLLITKCRARIPVIIMGQAGCGKTSLVQFLAERILKEYFRKINFHAGITPKLLRKELGKICEEAKILKEEGKKLWLFLDEINTSETLNLVAEMMTYDTYQGAPIVSNIQYIAAINPYSKRAKKGDIGLLVRKKYRKMQELDYNVHPLPESLFNFVWDFGQLNVDDEKSYLNQMLRNASMSEGIRDVSLNCMLVSHIFMREKEGLGSVSLRDAKRFIAIYEWFRTSVLIRTNMAQRTDLSYSELIPYSIKHSDYTMAFGEEHVQIKAVVLALAICYYTRLENLDDRVNYLNRISVVMKNSREGHFTHYDREFMLMMVKEEQEEYLERIKKSNNQDLMRGIAYNTALKENLFTMLVCLMNRIPVIICGEPGCSKTLSFQLLLNSLRGVDSDDLYFKTLPRLLVFTYQGSFQSTSEGILHVFDKAQRVLKDNYHQNSSEQGSRKIISVVFFDEMGLAELSKNNPLKVLHSLLEYDAELTEEDLKMKVGFVGISNWRLDISKMSRVIFVAQSQPTLEDLKQTADSIIQSFGRNFLGFEKYSHTLAETYFEFRSELENSHEEYQNFHGLRDFYSLMKETCKYLIKEGLEKSSNETICECLNYAIERNFGGLSNSVLGFKKILEKKLDKLKFSKIPVKQLIRFNFEDPEARYLMLVIRGNFGSQIISDQLGISSKKYKTIIGSPFEQDLDQDEYSAKILSTIINCLEEGISLIMQGLDTIYPSLYDLFNQNFTIISKKKTCRIALGTTTNITCSVHDDFRCIVLVDEQQLIDQEPPFLNRFEKQIISWESILSDPKMISVFEEAKAWLTRFCTPGMLHNTFVLSPHWMVINFSDENIACVVAEYWNEQEPESNILERIKKEILLSSSADIIPASCLSQCATQKNEIIEYYYQQPHQSLTKFLQVMLQQHKHNEISPLKSIVYTYSTTFDPLGLENLNEYDEFKLASISSERELDSILTRFFEDRKLYFILRLKAGIDNKYFALAKLLIEKLSDHYSQRLTVHKHLVVIFHLNRKDALEGKQQPLSMTHMKGWNQIMIDSLQELHYVNFEAIMDLSSNELLHQKHNIIKTHQTLGEIITTSYLKLNFRYRNFGSSDLGEYINKIVTLLSNNDKIKDLILEKVNSLTTIEKNWLVEIVTNHQLLTSSKDVYHAVEKFFSQKIQYAFLQLIYSLEISGGMQTLLSLVESDSQGAQNTSLFQLWTEIFKAKDCAHKLVSKNMQNLVNDVPETRIPFVFEDIKACFEKLQLNQTLSEYKGIMINLFDYPDARDLVDSKHQLLEQTEKLIEDRFTLKYIKNLNRDSSESRLCYELIKLDIGTVFTTHFLKCDEKYAKIILTLLEDLVRDEYFFSEAIVTLLSFRRVLGTFTELIKMLNTKTADENSIVKYYNQIKSKSDVSVFENMVSAILKDLYPSKEVIERAGSWKAYYLMLSKVILHIQLICSELTIWMKAIKLFMFWRDLFELYSGSNCSEEEIEESISALLTIQQPENSNDYIYEEDAFDLCCETLEKLYQKPEFKTNPRFIDFFTVYLVDSYKHNRGSPLGIKIIEKALNCDYLSSGLASFIEEVLEDLNIEFTEEELIAVNEEEILKILNKKLKGLTDNRNLPVHIDYLLYKFHIIPHFEDLKEHKEKIAPTYIKNLWNEIQDKSYFKGELTVKAIGVFGLAKYLVTEYTESLLHPDLDVVLSQKDCKLIEDILNTQKNVLAYSLKVFALKSLSSKLGNLNSLVECNLGNEWLKDLKNVQNGKKKRIYSGYGDTMTETHSKYYKQFEKLTQSGKKDKGGEAALLEFAREIDKKDDRSLCSLRFFYHYCYWKFIQSESSVCEWSPEKFQKQLGLARAQILQRLINNFSKKYELLHLNPSLTPERIKLASVICQINISVISKLLRSKELNVFSFLLENGSFAGLADRMAASFLPGTEAEEGKHNEGQFVQVTSVKTGHCTCGFAYYFAPCAELLDDRFICPSCKIRMPNPTKAQKLRVQNNLGQNTGLGYLPPMDFNSIMDKNHTVRHLNPFTYRILSFVLHSLLYFVLAIGAVSEEEMYKLTQIDPEVPIEKFLRNYIELQWKHLIQRLGMKEDTYLILHAVIDSLVEKKSKVGKFKLAVERNIWELELETDILSRLLLKPQRNVVKYNNMLDADKIAQGLESDELDLSSIVTLSMYNIQAQSSNLPYIHLMRIPLSNSLELFESAFENENLLEAFPFIHLYLKKKEQLHCLSSLKQIISFTNYLSSQFNLKVLREDAINQTLGEFMESRSKEIQAELEEFQIAWARVSLIFINNDLKKFASFDKKSKVIALLPAEFGGKESPICTAFRQLAEIQNSILNDITTNSFILAKYPYLGESSFPISQIQDAAEENILLGLDVTRQVKTILELTSYPESSTDEDDRIVYNWKAVEENLARNFLIGKHLLSCERIRMTQFKGELPKDKDSDIVQIIAMNIPQKNLSALEVGLLENNLKRKSGNIDAMENLYTSLNIILIHLVRSKFGGHLTLVDVCKKIRVERLPYDILKDVDLKGWKLENLIQLYEKVEDVVYPELVSSLAKRFGEPFEKKQEPAVSEFVQASEEKGLVDVIVKGVQRFALRYLDDSLDGGQELKAYIGSKEGLWPKEKFGEVKAHIEGKFPSVVLVENTISLIKLMAGQLERTKDRPASIASGRASSRGNMTTAQDRRDSRAKEKGKFFL